MKATLHTNKGDIIIDLISSEAPVTVENFTKLSREGFYDGVKFHRVILGFMIQSGDPLTKAQNMKERWGTGGPGYAFADEIRSTNNNNRGTIAMANSGPNTNGSQFFINTKDNNFLDSKHTVFGTISEGMNVVEIIEQVETDARDCPLESVIIEKITISE